MRQVSLLLNLHTSELQKRRTCCQKKTNNNFSTWTRSRAYVILKSHCDSAQESFQVPFRCFCSYNVNQNPSDTDCCGPGMQPEWAWPKTWSGNFFPKLIFYTFSVEDNIFYPASGGGWEKSGRATASRDRGRGQTFLCFNSFVCLFVTLENMPHLPVKKSSTNPLI